jgi:hypothetical protein
MIDGVCFIDGCDTKFLVDELEKLLLCGGLKNTWIRRRRVDEQGIMLKRRARWTARGEGLAMMGGDYGGAAMMARRWCRWRTTLRSASGR